MKAALEDFKTLGLSTAKVSMLESYLTAKRLEAKGSYPDPEIAATNDAVKELFEVAPKEATPLGRLRAFRYDWLVSEHSGRKTVWNNTTRGTTLATTIFVGDDLRNGLRPDAAVLIADALKDDRLPSKQALVTLLMRERSFALNDNWETAETALCDHLSMSSGNLDSITDTRPLGVPLVGTDPWKFDLLPDHLRPQGTVAVSIPAGAEGGGREDSIVIDARLERMLRRAIQRYRCILLVGPPGTGKGALARWLSEAVATNPGEFGFQPDLVPNPMWKTPDEGWSAFDLVGGLAPDHDAKLVWSNGVLLNSIAEQRWLVLDETNRADMDKIMGPLLTWLSSQEVEVGRTRPHDGRPIHIGWNTGPLSLVEDSTAGPIRFLAGGDWRLLGTYNPQDAQRVFRMGQALSRRFVVVPVPALSPGQFEKLLSGTYPDLGDTASGAIAGIYSAHFAAPETVLGPAVFLRMAEYVEGVPETALGEHLAEAYVTSLGKFIAWFDDVTFEALGGRTVEDEQALTRGQWDWIAEQRLTIG